MIICRNIGRGGDYNINPFINPFQCCSDTGIHIEHIVENIKGYWKIEIQEYKRIQRQYIFFLFSSLCVHFSTIKHFSFGFKKYATFKSQCKKDYILEIIVIQVYLTDDYKITGI